MSYDKASQLAFCRCRRALAAGKVVKSCLHRKQVEHVSPAFPWLPAGPLQAIWTRIAPNANKAQWMRINHNRHRSLCTSVPNPNLIIHKACTCFSQRPKKEKNPDKFIKSHCFYLSPLLLFFLALGSKSDSNWEDFWWLLWNWLLINCATTWS